MNDVSQLHSATINSHLFRYYALDLVASDLRFGGFVFVANPLEAFSHMGFRQLSVHHCHEVLYLHWLVFLRF